nr:hypothetical protein [Tanacetum cinerariifolium]
MEVVREYPADERTAAIRTGLVGPAGVPGGVARMSNGLGLCRRQLDQQWSWDFEELPFGVEDVDVTRAVGEEELPTNVLEVLVSSLKDVSLSRSMFNRNLIGYAKRNDFVAVRWWLGWSITNSHGNQLGGDKELAERCRVRSG